MLIINMSEMNEKISEMSVTGVKSEVGVAKHEVD